MQISSQQFPLHLFVGSFYTCRIVSWKNTIFISFCYNLVNQIFLQIIPKEQMLCLNEYIPQFLNVTVTSTFTRSLFIFLLSPFLKHLLFTSHTTSHTFLIHIIHVFHSNWTLVDSQNVFTYCTFEAWTNCSIIPY